MNQQQPTFPASSSTPLEYSLFSPSKAAEQQRLAKDWNYVHQFLRQKYPSPQKVPRFEENEETLRMLLAVAAANERADEGWERLCGLEEEAVGELEREREDEGKQDTKKTLDNTLTTSLLTSLSPQGASDLTSQATTATILNTTTTSASALATTLLTLSTTLSSLQIQITATTSLQSSLLSQHSTLQTELDDLASPTFQTEKNLPQRTAELTRQTKLLKAKVSEYDERLRNASGAGIPEALLNEVETAKRGLENLVQRVKDVEDRIEVFEGVPPEAREVRRMMQDLRVELEGWVRRRDEMFEGLVGRR